MSKDKNSSGLRGERFQNDSPQLILKHAGIFIPNPQNEIRKIFAPALGKLTLCRHGGAGGEGGWAASWLWFLRKESSRSDFMS